MAELKRCPFCGAWPKINKIIWSTSKEQANSLRALKRKRGRITCGYLKENFYHEDFMIECSNNKCFKFRTRYYRDDLDGAVKEWNDQEKWIID